MKIFTYGTLMKDECRSSVMDECEFLGDAVLEDYGIIDLGIYPAAVKAPGYRIYGEVYEINESKKKELDAIEGEGYLYGYRGVNLILNDKETFVGIYVFLRARGSERLMEPNGKWHSR